MVDFIVNYTQYLGFGDYVFILLGGFFLILGILAMLNEEIGLLVLVVIILAIVIYINYIPYGQYKARFTKINNKVVGVGSEADKNFTVDIDKQYFRFDNKQKLPPYPAKTDYYKKAYGNKDFYVTITLMGTAKTHSKVLNADIDIDY